MRKILHCDLNNFFASVECLRDPKLKNVPMAVCGDPNTRHGIILAKNELAKKYGIYTPETVFSAKKKCRNLVLVRSHYEDYKKYSNLVNNIYLKYTDRVEKYSIDESSLDVTESTRLFGNEIEIAYKIKEEVKNTLGLTISVGVSFNKSLAKLGSDLKKPDAVTVIPYENFREIIYPLPVEELLYVGKKAKETLNKMGIKSIGDLALSNKTRIIKHLGKLGAQIHDYANGIDFEQVKKYDDIKIAKSFSKGMTFKDDIFDMAKLEEKIRVLASEISRSLRNNNLKCTVVSLSIKDEDFYVINRQRKIPKTNIFKEIVDSLIDLLYINYKSEKGVRAITVSVSDLVSENSQEQINMFEILEDDKKIENDKIEKASKVLDDIATKYGNEKINFGSIINKEKYKKIK